MSEFRRSKRKKPAEIIEVFDTMTEQSVGRVSNLSETGMMLMTGARLIDDALFQFRFTLTDANARTGAVEVGAHHLWSDEASVAGQYWAGFRFIDVDPEDLARIRSWIERPNGKYV
ncbi:MAG TPA: PilZ domain-containing protein [Xanthomonadaceae bacterium]|nr:PilZ domain-containing protein [Xanthomonadaceae bacterium]